MSSRQAILITGAARRVGEVICLHFARAGFDIALHYHRSQSEAQHLKAQVEAHGVTCHLFACDLSDTVALPALIESVHAALPHCSALINNASIFERASFMETDELLFDRQMSVNLKAPFFLTQAFARRFGKGCVINILDTDIVQSQGSHFAYLLSKKALAEFTSMAARALCPAMRVNGVCPGIMLPSNELDEAYMDSLLEKNPLKHLAQVDQVAETAHWLCQNAAITGQLIFIDGGQHLL